MIMGIMITCYLLIVFASYGVIFDFWYQMSFCGWFSPPNPTQIDVYLEMAESFLFSLSWPVTLFLVYRDSKRYNIDLSLNYTGKRYK